MTEKPKTSAELDKAFKILLSEQPQQAAAKWRFGDHRNLTNGQRVLVDAPALCGHHEKLMGTVVGCSFRNVIDSYIVLFDSPNSLVPSKDYQFDAVCIPENFLEPVAYKRLDRSTLNHVQAMAVAKELAHGADPAPLKETVKQLGIYFVELGRPLQRLRRQQQEVEDTVWWLRSHHRERALHRLPTRRITGATWK
jgi:hypothetical protein